MLYDLGSHVRVAEFHGIITDSQTVDATSVDGLFSYVEYYVQRDVAVGQWFTSRQLDRWNS